MKVKLIKLIDKTGSNYSSLLNVGEEYEVLGIESDFYRLLPNFESNIEMYGAYLFDPSCFEISDLTEPAFWEQKIGNDGEKYCYPLEWSPIGFFEDYFEGREDNWKIFWAILKVNYPETYIKNEKAVIKQM